MNLCKYGIHRWEEEEGGMMESSVMRCKDCGVVIKDNPMGKVYQMPEGEESRVVDIDKTIIMLAAGGVLATALFLLSRRK